MRQMNKLLSQLNGSSLNIAEDLRNVLFGLAPYLALHIGLSSSIQSYGYEFRTIDQSVLPNATPFPNPSQLTRRLELPQPTNIFFKRKNHG